MTEHQLRTPKGRVDRALDAMRTVAHGMLARGDDSDPDIRIMSLRELGNWYDVVKDELGEVTLATLPVIPLAEVVNVPLAGKVLAALKVPDDPRDAVVQQMGDSW